MHDLQRTIYRRGVCSFAIAIAGFVSGLIRRFLAPDDSGDTIVITWLLAVVAMGLGVLDARGLRTVQIRLQVIRNGRR